MFTLRHLTVPLSLLARTSVRDTNRMPRRASHYEGVLAGG
jgi:hypothetical protein